jgi:PadR family transcriptional regulator PadR
MLGAKNHQSEAMTDRRTTAASSAVPDPASGGRRTRTRDSDRGGAPKPDQAAADSRNPGPEDVVERIEERDPLPGGPPRDILAPFVLLAVSLQRAHGYVIEDYLRALGLFGITMSTLYRTLRQMEKDGFVESAWEPGPTGPARRVYTITDAGHAWLDSSAAMLKAYSETIDRFFGLYGSSATRPKPDEPTDEKETQG